MITADDHPRLTKMTSIPTLVERHSTIVNGFTDWSHFRPYCSTVALLMFDLRDFMTFKFEMMKTYQESKNAGNRKMKNLL